MKDKGTGTVLALAVVAAGLAVTAEPRTAHGAATLPAVSATGDLLACAPTSTDPTPPEYYALPLVSTKRVPQAYGAAGTGEVTFARSPFGVAVAADGSFAYDLHLSVSRLRAPPRGTWVAWVTTPEIDHVRRVGALDERGTVRGRVEWNKFLVVITLEETDDPAAEAWAGPVALRGMSRSGRMHTMAGHGPFQQENCAAYGFGG